jgi:hypothetical protein
MKLALGRTAVIGLSLVLAGALAAIADDHDHAKRRHHVITIDSMTVHPQNLQVSKDEVVVWANYSGRSVQVRFPEDVAGKFTCAVRPSFYRSGQGLLSRPFNSLEFAMPCRLQPGTYAYRIIGLSSEGEVFDPEQESPGDPQGKIEVR